MEDIRQDVCIGLVVETPGSVLRHRGAGHEEQLFHRRSAPPLAEVDPFERGRELAVIHVFPVTGGAVLPICEAAALRLLGGVAERRELFLGRYLARPSWG